jgi:Domain of unknown function (DUF222)
MIDVEAMLSQRPSAFELDLRSWLDRRARRHSVDYVSADPAEPCVVDFDPHGRGAAEFDTSADGALPASFASFAGLLESGASHLAAAARAVRLRQCRDAAELARALAAFAAARPAAVLDRPDGEVGAAAAASRAARPAVLTTVSEWAVDEVMVALGLSSPAAARLLADSVALTQQLPATLAALEAGTISWAHAQMLVEVLAPLTDAKRTEVEARLLARAAGRTVTQLRATARRAVLRADASAAARRLAKAIRERQVRVFPGRDGMASWVASMTTPVALACHNALEQYAEACKVPGDERTKDQRMVDCLAELILRPGETGLPPVQAQLTVVAGVDTLRGGDEPGEIDGHPVPAAVVRELAYALGLLPRPETDVAPAEAAATEAEPSETPPIEQSATHAPAADPADTRALPADEAAAARIAELLGLTTVAGTALAHLPTIAVAEEISGQLLALTSAAGIRAAATCRRRACRTGKRPCTHATEGRCLGPPPDSEGYRPSDPLQRFVTARDRRCRFPGCRAPAIRCDLDHNMPWPAGTTSADNLCCLCRHHHRLSHQAPGWTMRRLLDGGLEWTTPGGDRITTHPPRYGSDDTGPPGTPDAEAPRSQPPPRDPPLTARELVLGRPLPPGTVDDDPAPF